MIKDDGREYVKVQWEPTWESLIELSKRRHSGLIRGGSLARYAFGERSRVLNHIIGDNRRGTLIHCVAMRYLRIVQSNTWLYSKPATSSTLRPEGPSNPLIVRCLILMRRKLWFLAKSEVIFP